MPRAIVWFRGKDLRLADHAPLRAALGHGEVIPLFVLDPFFFAPERARQCPRRIQFLLDSLRELATAIAARGSQLVVVAGKSVDVVPALAAKWRADRVLAQRWVEPFGRERDRRIAEACRLELFEGETLHPPGTLRTAAGKPYAVFTQFARAFARDAVIGDALPAPRTLPALPIRARSIAIPTIEALGLPRDTAIVAAGEKAAHARLRAARKLDYAATRDRMDLPGTSRLSQDLKFGTLSPRAAWTIDQPVFRNELVWREFTHSTLWDRPELLEQPFQPAWQGFPYRDDPAGWRAWVEGTTGYPIVDAAARQLLGEGFVHNRARMIAASFLTKHLLIDYRRGEAHYLQYLVDGDWANNNAGWQWAAGCGADAQPYFRVFNPTLQGQRFDPDGAYVRRWVPELAHLPARDIHAPPPTRGYPAPIVDHRAARERFLAVARDHLRRRGRRSPRRSR